MSVVKYRESHYVRVLDMYDNVDSRAVCSRLLFQVPFKLDCFANSLVTLEVTNSFAALNSFLLTAFINGDFYFNANHPY